jgi:hypothetical protein
MRQSPSAVAAATLALGFLAGAPTVHAEPRCGFQGDWDCYGPPQYNGPGVNRVGRPGNVWRLDVASADVPAWRRLAAVPGIRAAAMIGGL